MIKQIGAAISFLYGFYLLFLGKAKTTTAYIFIGGGLLLYFWDSVQNWFIQLGTDDPTKGQDSVKSKVSGVSDFDFNVWKPYDYKNIIRAGYTGTAREWVWCMAWANSLLDSSIFNLALDSKVLSKVREIQNRYEFNKVVSAFAGTSNWFWNPSDLYTWLKDSLSEESFNEVKKIVANLPEGYK